jgi:uncharacterized membrane protein YphA (DoxX/SURF4 family)
MKSQDAAHLFVRITTGVYVVLMGIAGMSGYNHPLLRPILCMDQGVIGEVGELHAAFYALIFTAGILIVLGISTRLMTAMVIVLVLGRLIASTDAVGLFTVIVSTALMTYLMLTGGGRYSLRPMGWTPRGLL